MREGAELLIEAGQFYEAPRATTRGSWGMSRDHDRLGAEYGVRAYGGSWLRPSGDGASC